MKDVAVRQKKREEVEKRRESRDIADIDCGMNK